MSQILQNIVLGISLAAPIGPANIAVIRRGLKYGFLPAFLVGLGVVFADMTYLLLIYFGLANFGADLLLISTAVERVYLNFNKPDQKPIDVMTVAEARRYMDEGHFAKGSMLPKIQAIIWFLEAGGGEAIITNPENIARALCGEMGTRIVP